MRVVARLSGDSSRLRALNLFHESPPLSRRACHRLAGGCARPAENRGELAARCCWQTYRAAKHNPNDDARFVALSGDKRREFYQSLRFTKRRPNTSKLWWHCRKRRMAGQSARAEIWAVRAFIEQRFAKIRLSNKKCDRFQQSRLRRQQVGANVRAAKLAHRS